MVCVHSMSHCLLWWTCPVFCGGFITEPAVCMMALRDQSLRLEGKWGSVCWFMQFSEVFPCYPHCIQHATGLWDWTVSEHTVCSHSAAMCVCYSGPAGGISKIPFFPLVLTFRVLTFVLLGGSFPLGSAVGITYILLALLMAAGSDWAFSFFLEAC